MQNIYQTMVALTEPLVSGMGILLDKIRHFLQPVFEFLFPGLKKKERNATRPTA